MEQGAFTRRELLIDELAEQFLLPGHRFRADDVRATDPGSIRRLEPQSLPRPLRAQPKGKAGDLRRARVDVDAVDVVLHDEAGDFPPEGGSVGVVENQGPAGDSGQGPVVSGQRPSMRFESAFDSPCIKRPTSDDKDIRGSSTGFFT